MVCGLSFNVSADLTVSVAEVQNQLQSEIQRRTRWESELDRLSDLLHKESVRPPERTKKAREERQLRIEKWKKELASVRGELSRPLTVTVKTDNKQAIAAIGKLAKGGFSPVYCLKTLCRYKIDPIKTGSFRHLINEALDKNAGDIAKGEEIIEDRQATLFYDFQGQQFRTKSDCEKHRKDFAFRKVGPDKCLVYDPNDGSHFSKVILYNNGTTEDNVGYDRLREMTTKAGGCQHVKVAKVGNEYPRLNIFCDARYELNKYKTVAEPLPKEGGKQ